MLRTFDTEEEKYKKFKEICIREGIAVGDKLNEFMEKYIKEHGEGNPIYQLDKWQDKNFKMTPAFFESYNKWLDFLTECSDNEILEAYSKSQSLYNTLDKIRKQRGLF